MKGKTLLLAGGLLLLSVAAKAQQHAYLTFRATDGTEKSIATKALKITFPNGQMKAVAGTAEVVYELASLQSMFFASKPTAIEAVQEQMDAVRIVNGALQLPAGPNREAKVYTPDGRLVGTQQLSHGVYLVRWNGRTYKVMAQ